MDDPSEWHDKNDRVQGRHREAQFVLSRKGANVRASLVHTVDNTAERNCSTDLVGCVETDSPLYFPLLDLSDNEWETKSKAPPIKLSSGFCNIISIFSLGPELVENLKDGQTLTGLLMRAGKEILPFINETSVTSPQIFAVGY